MFYTLNLSNDVCNGKLMSSDIQKLWDISNGRIAQLVERGANNAAVLGSSPSMTIVYLLYDNL